MSAAPARSAARPAVRDTILRWILPWLARVRQPVDRIPQAFGRCIRAGSLRSALFFGGIAALYPLQDVLPAPRLAALGARADPCTGCWQLLPATAGSQESQPLVISGEVRIGDELADSGTVVLHRVSPFFSGEVDSVSVSRDGFEFVIPNAFDSLGDDVYFVSLRYQDVLYFGGMVSEAADTVGAYLIRAYPAVGAGPLTRLPVSVRNTFLERSGPAPGWVVTDLFEIRNNTAMTVVASEQGAAWSHALPPGAVDFEVGQSDLQPDAASFRGGVVQVSAPVPPGERVYLFRYRVPGDAFTLPLEGGTGSMELLFREPAGEITVDGLAALGPIDMEGATYRRFAGRDLAATVVTVAPGRSPGPSGSIPLVAALLALALTVAGSLLAVRTPSRVHARTIARRRRVLLEIARLDERWSHGKLDNDEYGRRRRRLLAELAG